jgi:hypothetical protein
LGSLSDWLTPVLVLLLFDIILDVVTAASGLWISYRLMIGINAPEMIINPCKRYSRQK